MTASRTRIYFLLQRAAHRLKSCADAALLEAGGLSTAQAAVLTVIANNGPANQNFIARALSQRESAITAMGSRLKKAGYISKRRSRNDARAWELDLTDEGREALAQIRAPFDVINARLDRVFSEDELTMLAKMLEEVFEAFEDFGQPAASGKSSGPLN
ncbi:MAG: MarR family transcriptional regulator [Pseudomonadota bacterium]